MRTVAICSDLMFGSRISEGLNDPEQPLEIAASVDEARVEPGDTVVVDLTSQRDQRIDFVRQLKQNGELSDVRTIGIYSHIDVETRQLAEDAGFDLVVPRSRFVRDMRQLVRP